MMVTSVSEYEIKKPPHSHAPACWLRHTHAPACWRSAPLAVRWSRSCNSAAPGMRVWCAAARSASARCCCKEKDRLDKYFLACLPHHAQQEGDAVTLASIRSECRGIQGGGHLHAFQPRRLPRRLEPQGVGYKGPYEATTGHKGDHGLHEVARGYEGRQGATRGYLAHGVLQLPLQLLPVLRRRGERVAPAGGQLGWHPPHSRVTPYSRMTCVPEHVSA